MTIDRETAAAIVLGGVHANHVPLFKKGETKRFYRAHLVEVGYRDKRRWTVYYRWVVGYSEHPDGRWPNYPRKHLELAARAAGARAHIIRNPKPEDWQRS